MKARMAYGGQRFRIAGVKPSECRRSKSSNTFPSCQNDEQAWDQLSGDKVVPKVTCCHLCQSQRVTGPFWASKSRPCHWRCLECDSYISWHAPVSLEPLEDDRRILSPKSKCAAQCGRCVPMVRCWQNPGKSFYLCTAQG